MGKMIIVVRDKEKNLVGMRGKRRVITKTGALNETLDEKTLYWNIDGSEKTDGKATDERLVSRDVILSPTER